VTEGIHGKFVAVLTERLKGLSLCYSPERPRGLAGLA